MIPRLSTLGFILRHPGNQGARFAALLRFFRWQIRSRLGRGPLVHTWVSGVKFLVRRGETGLTGNIYCGLHEFADMAYVLHVLRPGQLFVDVGANAGSYTLLAAGVKRADVIAIEPVPETFARLVANVDLNELGDRVRCFNVGVADSDGDLTFVLDGDTVNRVAVGMEPQHRVASIRVRTLDDILDGAAPSVVKIDVEGYELPVLQGAVNALANPHLHSVIIETNGSGERYGFKDDQLIDMLKSSGFRTYSYDPMARRLSSGLPLAGSQGNTLFVRNATDVEAMLREAPSLEIGTLRL